MKRQPVEGAKFFLEVYFALYFLVTEIQLFLFWFITSTVRECNECEPVRPFGCLPSSKSLMTITHFKLPLQSAMNV